MLRNPSGTSATDIILWLVFGLNLTVIVASLLINYIWLWLLSFTISFSILMLYRYRREQLLDAFYTRKKILRKSKRARKYKTENYQP